MKVKSYFKELFKEHLPRKELREELGLTTNFIQEENKIGKNLAGDLLVTLPWIVGGALTVIGAAFAYDYFIRDKEAPEIESLKYKDRVFKRENQEFFACVKEKNPEKYAILNLNNTKIEIPFDEKDSCYKISFDPSKYWSKEGIVKGELIVPDKYNNISKENVSFFVNLESPKIEGLDINRKDVGIYEISGLIKDDNLENAFLLIDNNRIDLNKNGNNFYSEIKTLKDLEFKLCAFDKFNLSSCVNGKIEFSQDNPNVYYALNKGLNQSYIDLIKPLDNDGKQDLNEREFVDLLSEYQKFLVIPTYLNYLRNQTSDGIISNEELNYSKNFSSLVERLYENVLKGKIDELKVKANNAPDKWEAEEILKKARILEEILNKRIVDNSTINVLDYSSSLGLKLNFDRELASNATAKVLGYYGIAVVERKLPEEFDAISLLTKATQDKIYGENIVDFEPIVINDAANRTILIGSLDIGRDTWMLAHLLKERPYLVEQPKKYEWINRMIQEVAYDIFDDEYSLNSRWIEPHSGKEHLPENVTPTNKEVWEVILGFHDYMDKLPEKLKKDNLPIVFPYYDSDLLKSQINDKVGRTIALFLLAKLPNATYDWSREEIVPGMEGIRVFLKQLPWIYEEMKNAWKDPNSEGYKNAMVAYKMWLNDRFVHGMKNTVKQFSGTWPFEQPGTIDDFLNKNWENWKFAKFPYAYMRGRGSYGPDFNIKNYGEWEMYDDGLPLAYKAFGIPLGEMYGDGTSGNLGGPGNYFFREFAIYGIPDSIINSLLNERSLGRIAVGYGNGISLTSCIDGFEKDSGYQIYEWFRHTPIYLWKKGKS
ncbi:hypothetical protein MA03_02715 [Infirmifilum uzonense]|uniref:Uncharacterized protein n=1 Tax=Infirmifilum uzonense TaxID=1550241 RepID=A0A0F7FHP7_9CREN|nr:hypothetical protein [Infirmifilum uzonense]AKG38397.1 hypothetical protein MA03_02715 [Infirmifilum uzonense]